MRCLGCVLCRFAWFAMVTLGGVGLARQAVRDPAVVTTRDWPLRWVRDGSFEPRWPRQPPAGTVEFGQIAYGCTRVEFAIDREGAHLDLRPLGLANVPSAIFFVVSGATVFVAFDGPASVELLASRDGGRSFVWLANVPATYALPTALRVSGSHIELDFDRSLVDDRAYWSKVHQLLLAGLPDPGSTTLVSNDGGHTFSVGARQLTAAP